MALVVLFAGFAAAQKLGDSSLTGAPGEKTKAQFVRFVPVPAITAVQNRPHPIRLQFEVAAGDHVNSNKPGSDLLIPTRLRFNTPTDLLIAKIKYPEGKDLSFDFAPDVKLNVYTGMFEITATVTPDRTASLGLYKVHGQLEYQACNDRACFPPQNLPIAFDVRVARAAGTGRRNPRQSPHIHR